MKLKNRQKNENWQQKKKIDKKWWSVKKNRQEILVGKKKKNLEFKETYELCDIWRVRNTNSKRFTFTQKYSSGFVQRRLEYILISNTLPEFVTMTVTQCLKSVQIRSFFWSVFSRIRTEYKEILRISSYSVRMRENTDQKKLRIWTLFTQ